MTWVAAGVGVGSLVAGTATSLYGSSKASKEQRAAEERFNARLSQASGEVAQYADEYSSFLTKLDEDFDPYDVEDAFNGLYEAVIQPMERDFDENVLPGIQKAYSGGIMGAGAGLSGAQASAESQAHRGLSEKKAGLKYQASKDAVGINFADYERRAGTAGEKFRTQTAAPMLRAGQAPMMYGAETDTIAAKLAGNQSIAGGFQDLGSLAMSTGNLNQQRKFNNNLETMLQGRIGSNRVAGGGPETIVKRQF